MIFYFTGNSFQLLIHGYTNLNTSNTPVYVAQALALTA